MTDQVLRDALREMARELTAMRQWRGYPLDAPSEQDVDDTVQEFLSKARGFEGSEEAP